MALDVLLFLIGLFLLALGGDILVRYAAALAKILGVRPLLIALTVVAFGTSAPELVACLIAGANVETRGIVLGNIVGSNIANVCLILGLCAVVRPLRVSTRTWTHELMILVAVTLGFALLSLNGILSRLDGAILLVWLAAFTVYCFLMAMRHRDEEPKVAEDLEAVLRAKATDAGRPILRYLVLSGCGLGMLVLGAKLLVGAAVNIAHALHVSETLIGLTIVAIGTSLPELATSVAAIRRKETDIIVGNALGSNIINVLFVLGVSVVLYTIAVPVDVLFRDFAVMVVVTLLLLPFLRTRGRLGRREGAVLLVLYVAYLCWAFKTGAIDVETGAA